MKKILIALMILLVFCSALCFVSCDKSTTKEIEYKPRITLNYNIKNEYVECKEKIEYESMITSENILLQFNPLAFRDIVVDETLIDECYPNGVSYCDVEIVYLAINGTEKSYRISKTMPVIEIDSPVFYGENAVVEMEYSLKLPNIIHRFGYNDKLYNLSGGYAYVCPIVDGDYSPRSYSTVGENELLHMTDFTAMVTLSDKLIMLNSGEVIDLKKENGYNTYTIESNDSRDFALMYGYDLVTRHADYEDTKITYYFFRDSSPFVELEQAESALSVYSELFGEYNRKNLKILLAPFPWGGMEYTDVVLISSSINESKRESVIAHEIAHQWWFMQVGNDQAYAPWIDESLAEFSTALYYLNTDRGAVFEQYRTKGLTTLENRIIAGKPYNINGTVYNYNSDDYADCVYTLGCLMWINLYSIEGPELITRLSDYANKMTNSIATQDTLSENVFKGYETLMHTWLNGDALNTFLPQ